MVNRLRDRDADCRDQADILIVQTDPKVATRLGRRALEFFDRPALLAGSLCEAEAVLDERAPRIALVEMHLPDGDASELLLRLERDGVPAVAVVTAAASLNQATVALRTRVADLLVRPFTDQRLAATFERLARRLAEHDELCRLRAQATASEHVNRQLRLKIDILCKDLVGGYQKLVTRLARP